MLVNKNAAIYPLNDKYCKKVMARGLYFRVLVHVQI